MTSTYYEELFEELFKWIRKEMLMLHFITQKSKNFHNRYLGHREETENRVQEEDELTSLIMSPLALLPPQAIGMFWQRLVSFDQKQFLPSGPVSKATMDFWSRRMYVESGKRKSIEPDIYVKLEWPSGERRYLLVEFKWHAPLNPEDQLHKQWLKFLCEEERQNGYHIFIGPYLSPAINALNMKDVWNGKLLLRSWLHILTLFAGLKNDNEAQMLVLWMEQVQSLLELLHIHPFIGFNNLKHYQPLPTFPESWLFWDGFTGLGNLVLPKNSHGN